MTAHNPRVEIFNDSLERCRRSGDFLEAFYRHFMASSPAVRGLFAHADFPRLKRMLMASLYLLMLASDGHPEGQIHLERMARMHAKIGFPLEMYDLWLECLLETVKRCDSRFTPAVGEAWRVVLTPGIQMMVQVSGRVADGARADSSTNAPRGA